MNKPDFERVEGPKGSVDRTAFVPEQRRILLHTPMIDNFRGAVMV